MGNKTLKILCIDDDKGCLLATARYFTLIGGHRVETAENGKKGLQKAAELKPDIILVDLVMPDMSGIEVIEALYSNPDTREVPVILVTGADMSRDEIASLVAKPNFMFFEQKPSSFSRLLGRIERGLLSGIFSPASLDLITENTTEPA